VLQHVIVPETDYANALGVQRLSATFIVNNGASIVVLSAIKFHGEVKAHAIKIEDVPRDWELAAEFEALQTSRAQDVPDLPLGVGHVVTHLSREAEQAAVVIATWVHR